MAYYGIGFVASFPAGKNDLMNGEAWIIDALTNKR